MQSLTKLVVEGCVAELVMNRPLAANALSRALIEEMSKQLDAIARRTDVHVIILGAEGRNFCAGMDLVEASTATAAEIASNAASLAALSRRLREHRFPVVARVQGAASAAGLELAMSCDLVYAARSSRFATPGIKVGMWCMTPMVPLTRAIGARKAAEMLLLGHSVDAATALQIGMVTDLFDDDVLVSRVRAIALALTASSPSVMAIGRRALKEQAGMDFHAAYERALQGVAENAADPDAREGMRAFAEKRAPKWAPLVQAPESGD
ncbi:MAG: enoyl-CoA hydratase-related protein [Burkholderiaceae bacterium]|nr:enoyl-CoA hydratase-related protein [Burkholderiaceae bacterium]